MKKARSPAPADYAHLLKEIKCRILQVQTRVIFTINATLIYLYGDIGIYHPRLPGWAGHRTPGMRSESTVDRPGLA